MSIPKNEDQNTHILTNQTNNYLKAFVEADAAYTNLFQEFYQEHEAEFQELDKLREARNKALDEVKHSLREDTKKADYNEVKVVMTGPFKVLRKWSGFFQVDGFVELAKNQGDAVYQSAVDEGAIAIRTEVDYNKARLWLEKNSLLKKFQQVEDGKEQTPAVYGPKEVPPFGAPLK